MRKRACSNIDALKKQILIATILFAGLFILPKIMIAQDTDNSPHWQIAFKKQCYKLGIKTIIDTITITKKQQKETICITYKNDNASSELAGKKIIIVMSPTRQELGRYDLKDNSATIPLPILIEASTERLMTLNLVQQPASLLAKRARIGTKLLCYLKW
jgi:hypothetical protein